MRDAVIILIILLLVAVGILGYFVHSMSATLTDQKRQISDLSAKAKTSSLDLQEKCAKQAAWVFKDSGSSQDSMATYQNHYNENLNKCFVMMADTKHVAGNLSHFRQLMDAFEGKDLGYFLKNVTDPSGPLDCRVTLPSGKEEHCSTQEEFEQLAKVYMQ